MNTAIVICTRNRGELIRETLESVAASTHEAYRAIVVDQSTDEATGRVALEFAGQDPRFRYHKSATRGLSRARNIGVREAGDADLIVFTDDDVRVDPYWLANLVEEFERHPDVAGIFGRVLPDGPSVSGIYLAVKEDVVREEFQGNVDVYAGHGANMAFRRGVLEEAGGFDEALGAGGVLYSCEDIDIRVRVLDRGHKLLYLPSSLVYHKQERSWPVVRAVQRTYAKGTGACYVKYLRCGRWFGLTMLLRWFLKLGLREVLVGILRLSPPRLLNGWYQLTLPWVGVFRGLKFPLDKLHMTYLAGDR